MQTRVITDLAQLPRTSDSWTFLYTEKVRVERADYAIELRDKTGRIAVPTAALSVLLLGPGTSITHAAIGALAESGCSVVWCGENATRFYASGSGETRRAHHLEAQAKAWASKKAHEQVVRRMYLMRFPEALPEGLTIEQIRGKEGARVRDVYAELAKETGVRWAGRNYDRGNWGGADPVNRALSSANAALYGVCHAAIVGTGFAAGLGFLHVGKQLSFVYDVADLYKTETTIPAAFRAAAEGVGAIESTVRKRCRDLFASTRLMERIVPDMQRLMGLAPEKARLVVHRGEEPDEGDGPVDSPGTLWNPDGSRVAGGQNFAEAKRGPGLAKASRSPTEPGDAFESDLDFDSMNKKVEGVPF